MLWHVIELHMLLYREVLQEDRKLTLNSQSYISKGI